MGITDGTVICALCGDWCTTCPLCVGEEKLIDRTRQLNMEAIRRREADDELRRQEEAIRDSAEKRRGFP